MSYNNIKMRVAAEPVNPVAAEPVNPVATEPVNPVATESVSDIARRLLAPSSNVDAAPFNDPRPLNEAPEEGGGGLEVAPGN